MFIYLVFSFFLFQDKGILNIDSSELQEGWYNSNIVAPFFDDCLASLNDCILRRYVLNKTVVLSYIVFN